MTNAEILSAVARAVNDATFAKRNKAIQLGILTDAQNYLIDKTECLRKIDSASIVLAADTGSYNMPASFVKFPTEGADIKRGFVQLGTFGNFPLTFIPLTLLNNQYPGWRKTSSGIPEFFSLSEEGLPQLFVYPKPSASFIATNGSAVFMEIIYKPTTALLEDANLPFDNAARFSGLFQTLLRLRAIWQIKLEDMQFADADRLGIVIDKLIEQAIDFVQSFAPSRGAHGFEEQLG